MSETFTKETIRARHVKNVQAILNQGKGAEEIANYIMSRIGTVISYERRKYENRIAVMNQTRKEK